MLRAALLAVLLATAGFGPGGEPVLVTNGKPVRLARAVTTSAPPAFAALAHAGWTAIWDRDTGVPLRISGTHLDAPGSVADPAIAEQVARAFLAANLAVLAPGAALADFVVSGNSVDHLGIRTVGFAQTAQGLPVLGGQLGFVFAHDRLFVIGSEALPNVHVAMAPSHVELARVEAWVRGTAKATGARAILPLVRGGSIEYRLVDIVAATATPGAWDVYVDPTGEPIARATKVLFDTAAVAFNAGVRYATSTRMDFPARELSVTVNGSPGTTGADGTFPFTGGAATILVGTAGLRVRIANEAGALATTTLSTTPGGTAVWNLMDDERTDAQLATYVYGNLIKARDRVINPSVASWIDQPLTFHVNRAQDACNAESTGEEVFFGPATAMCENTGRLADVVFHEFGHSFHSHTQISGLGAFPGTMSEGFADFNAANYNEDPGIGRGFDFTDAPGRNIDPVGSEAIYPRDLSSDVHVSGLIMAGALYDLRKAAILVLGHAAGVALAERVFTGVMQRAADFPMAYNAALIVDDDDGDLGNGTPHGCLIAEAFAAHGLVANFETTTAGTPTLNGLSFSVPLERPANGPCAAPAVKSAVLTWQANGGASADVQLVATGNTYAGSIPAQADHTLVTYSVLITLDNGASFAFPDNLADPKYQQWVGATTPIYCASMDTDPKWMQTSLHGVQWEWALAGLSTSSPDPRVAHTGDHVLGLNLDFGGNYLASEMTRITMPAIDTSLYDHVHLQYWRWLTVERAMYDPTTIEVNGTVRWQSSKDLEFTDREWRFQDLDVSGTPTTQVAWTLTSDDSGQFGGWTLDDVCLVGYGKHALCGDGVVDEGEACDDGNTVDGDACTATCTTSGSDGGCCSANRAPAGALVLALGVVGFGFRGRRRVSAKASRR